MNYFDLEGKIMKNNEIKVLQINAENFGAGGISVIIWRLMEELENKKVQFSFLSQRDKAEKIYIDRILSDGGNIHYIKISTNIIWRYFERYFKCLEVLKQNNYDIVHINGNEAFGIISYVLAVKRNKKCKVVVHAHSTKFMNGGHIFLKKVLKSFFQPVLLRNVDCMLACSSEAAKFMFGKKAEQAVIIKNGLQYEKYSFDTMERKRFRSNLLDEDKIVIGHVGRFVYPKNHEFILKVFEKASEKNEKIELWLIGEQQGEIYKQILDRVKKNGLQNKVRFLGMTEKVREHLSAMDVLLFPSRFEGLPLVLVEAQTNGLPIICSDVITQEAIFSKNVKKLSLDDDVELWVNELIRLGKEKRTGVDYESFLKSGFDISQNANVLWNEYRKL